MHMEEPRPYSPDDAVRHWDQRPWILAALLALAGLAIHLAGAGEGPDVAVPWRAAIMALVFFGAMAAAFTIDRRNWREPLIFAGLAGLVMAGIAWRAVAAGDTQATSEYAFMAGVIASALALPLFQADFHRCRFATPYRALHEHGWSDAIAAAGSLAFVGAAWLLLFVLSELFHLIRIDILRDLIKAEAFGWMWSGGAFGAALGILRNQARILGTLQSVAMVVLSVLAVPLAAGLALFLIAMIGSGPDVLWEATRSATPLLLTCAAGAWLLANAVIRDGDAQMSGSRVLRIAGLTLALGVLPLTGFAAVSLGTRIAQHGLSPERLWGLIAIAVAAAYGLAWFVAAIRGWRGGAWRERLRRANLHLAMGICGVALFLALPILDFGAISAANQVARLNGGKVRPDNFDFAALKWDFGDAGRRALARLTHSGNVKTADLARAAEAQITRPFRHFAKDADEFDIRVQPANPALERLVRDYLRGTPWICSERCVALDLGPAASGGQRVAIVNGRDFEQVILPEREDRRPIPADRAIILKPDSEVEIRRLEKRYIFVDGQPLRTPIGEE